MRMRGENNQRTGGSEMEILMCVLAGAGALCFLAGLVRVLVEMAYAGAWGFFLATMGLVLLLSAFLVACYLQYAG